MPSNEIREIADVTEQKRLNEAREQQSPWKMGHPTGVKDSEALSGKTTVPTVTPGSIFRTINRDPGPTGGVRTDLAASAMTSSRCALPWVGGEKREIAPVLTGGGSHALNRRRAVLLGLKTNLAADPILFK